MAGNEIDKLLNSKITGARRNRTRSFVIIAIVCVLIVCGTCFAASYAMHHARNRNQTGTQADSHLSGPEDHTPSSSQDGAPDDPSGPAHWNASHADIVHNLQLVWFDDDSFTLPESVAVSVHHQAEVVSRFQLDASNQWKYTWIDQYPAIELTLSGTFPEGVSAIFSTSDENFTITATRTPSAGDSSQQENSPTQSTDPAQDGDPTQEGNSDHSGSTAEQQSSVLPQTGNRLFIIPLLLALGFILIALGMVEIRKHRKGRELV